MLDVMKNAFVRLFPKPQDEALNQARNQAWLKAHIVVGYDEKLIRKDACGAWIVFTDFQNESSKNGWDLDLLPALSNENILTYRALHWRNKKSKDVLMATNPASRDFCITTAKD